MIEFQHDIEFDGHILTVFVEATGDWEYDANYGADADGNRGIAQWFLEGVHLEVYDSRGNDIKAKLEKRHENHFSNLIAAALEEVGENEDPEDR